MITAVEYRSVPTAMVYHMFHVHCSSLLR